MHRFLVILIWGFWPIHAIPQEVATYQFSCTPVEPSSDSSSGFQGLASLVGKIVVSADSSVDERGWFRKILAAQLQLSHRENGSLKGAEIVDFDFNQSVLWESDLTQPIDLWPRHPLFVPNYGTLQRLYVRTQPTEYASDADFVFQNSVGQLVDGGAFVCSFQN